MTNNSSASKLDLNNRVKALSPEKSALLDFLLKKQADSKPEGTFRISKRVNKSPVPLSFAQQRLWFLEQFAPGSAVYNTHIALHLKGELNNRALNQALNEIVSRHESLRTTFRVADGQPIQVIALRLDFIVQLVDYSSLPELQKELATKTKLKQEALKLFDFKKGPLFRTLLVRLTDKEHVLLFSMHHIISDGWSRGVFLNELSSLYSSYSLGKPTALADLPIQYADFSEWQRELMQNDILEQQLSYWKKRLNNPPVLELPTDRPRPPVQTYEGAKLPFIVPKAVAKGIKLLSKNQGATLFMTLLAAFKVLLFKYSAQEDLLVGTVIANRIRSELEGLIGFFANTLVLRTDLSGNPSFKNLLTRIHDITLSAYTHQDLPFEKLVAELLPKRDLNRNPLFQVMFVFHNDLAEKLELDQLTITRMDVNTNLAKFDLTLNLTNQDEALNGWLEYNTDLFDYETIERMAGHYKNILESITKNPFLKLSEFPILTKVERYQRQPKKNDTGVVYPRDKCIHQVFEEQVTRIPDSVAVAFEDKCLTYRELNEKANKLAHYLRKQGVGPEVLVGICMERSLEMIIGILGILKAGGAYVPLDPTYPKERLKDNIQDSQTSILVSQESLLNLIPKQDCKVICIDADWRTISKCNQHNLSSSITPESTAYVIYTSGSTGKPKGVLVSHYNVVRLFQATQPLYKFNQSDVWTLFHSFAFDFSVWEIWGALFYGGKLIVISYWQSRSFDIFHELLIKKKVTILNMTPSAFRQLIQADIEVSKDKKLSLRFVIFGGEELKFKDLKPWYQRHDDSHPQLVNMYGITETTVHVTYHPLSATAVDNVAGSVIGRPIPDLQVYLLDNNLQIVPEGTPGEIHIGGEGLARGYLNRPELTAEKFISHPFSNKPGAKLYKTGDLGRYLPDGDIAFLGRIDHQVKIRGFRIELGEIESILDQHPAVRETVVIAREVNSGDKRLVAYLTLQETSPFIANKLKHFLKEKLPYFMIPSAFVVLESMPLTPNGKTDRKALPTPNLERFDSETFYVSPRTSVEKRLADIWQEILGISKVGTHDNFFEIGGHSLLATQIISRVKNVFAVEVKLRIFFETPTIAELAKIISQTSKENNQPILLRTLNSRSKNSPLSFAQQRLWFLCQLEPDSPFYNIPLALRMNGHVNVTALEQSISEIICRHEALRTIFVTEHDQPMQKILPIVEFTLQKEDFRPLPTEQREEKIQLYTREESSRPFDLVAGPLFRATLIRLGQKEYVLLLMVHHIIFDGWSMGIFFRELSTLYNSFSREKKSPLSKLPIQYTDFSAWQREWLQGNPLSDQLSYWKKQLKDLSTLELPVDHPRPKVHTSNCGTYRFVLPDNLHTEIQALSRREDATLFMTLLAAFQALLSRYTEQSDIVVGTPIANRSHVEVEELIGFFANTLVIRTDTSNNPVFTELLKQVKRTLLEAYSHQDLPFEKLVEELHPDRDLHRNPLFQILFVMQNAPFSSLDLSGMTVRLLEIEDTKSKFDLQIFIEEREEGLCGHFVYNTDLFDGGSIKRMATHYQNLLEGIIVNPGQRLSALPLLTKAEKQQILEEWNNTSKDFHLSGDKSIHQLFEEQVKKTPDTIAIIYNEQHITYKELNSRANQLAHFLTKHGAGPDTLVGICIERSLELTIGLLGILKAGSAYVPFDPAYPKERLTFMLQDTQAQLILTQEELKPSLSENGIEMICLDADWPSINQESIYNPDTKVYPNNLVYVIYTSGSTGRPKGVSLPQQALVNLIAWHLQHPSLSKMAKTLQFASLSFDVSFQEIFTTLCSGGTLVMVQEAVRRDIEELARYIALHSIERLFLPFIVLQQLAEVMVKEKQLSFNLKEIITAGEQLQVTEPIIRLFNKLQGCILHNHYGPSESHVVTSFELSGSPHCWPILPPIGRPIDNTQIYLLDDHLKPVPIGLKGELYISGYGLAQDYLNRPKLTAEKFIPNPFSKDLGSRMYRTGDLASYLPDGNIKYLGRIDQQVKVRGFRIELGEIEAVLGRHIAVTATAVVIWESFPGDKRLIAYVVPDQNAPPSTRDLHSFLTGKLPNHMVPAQFIMLDMLPLSPNGKLDRKALPKPGSISLVKNNFVAPQTETEESLVIIWSHVLNLTQLSIHDNFFELGGHSLLATQVVSRMRDWFELEIPLQIVFEHPTVAGQAEYIENKLEDINKTSSLSQSPIKNREDFTF